MIHSTDVKVREEIESLHEFFVGWFSGALADAAFDEDFMPRFAPDLVLIPPAGKTLTLPELAAGVRAGYGTNPSFAIAIRNVRVRRAWDSGILATYEEWQRNALASTPQDNGRVATVLFTPSQPLRWLHVHETWLPPETMAAGPYDF